MCQGTEEKLKSLPEITTAARLAHLGEFGSVKELRLNDGNLSSIPAEHLASLVSCVKKHVYISNIRSADLISILKNVQCKYLNIYRQSLGRCETQALVRAMQVSVRRVYLGKEVNLDIEALIEYGGQGQCLKVILQYDKTADRFGEEIKSWAQRINWVLDDYVQNDQIYVRITKREALSLLGIKTEINS